jgi:hypothetical protein
MTVHHQFILDVTEETASVAKATFSNGNCCLAA